jgi:hypothetical protein
MIGLRGALNGDPGAESLVGGIDMDTAGNSWLAQKPGRHNSAMKLN